MTHGHQPVHVQEDVLQKRTIVWVVAISLVVMVVSIWVAWLLLVHEEAKLTGGRHAPVPPRRAPDAISNVNQTSIEVDHAGRARFEAEQSLTRYEWVDREQGIVRIPIDRAIELRAKGVKP